MLQAVLWKSTGLIEATALVGPGSLIGLCLFLRLYFKVPAALSFMALIAVPLVAVHATGVYVDLPANAAATVGLLLLFSFLVEPDRFGPKALIGFFAACAFFAHAKLQAGLPAMLTASAFVTAWVLNLRQRPTSGPSTRMFLVIAVIGIGLIGLNPLINLIAFGNPLYPIQFRVGPLHFPGEVSAEKISIISGGTQFLPAPLRWLVSVLEVNAFGLREVPWTADQGSVPADAWSNRMGGYGVFFVLGNAAFLFGPGGAAGDPSRARIHARRMMVALTLVTSLLPQAFELRYYMAWMLCLVCLNLILLSGRFSGPDQAGPRAYYTAMAVICAASVMFLTGGRYVFAPPHHRDRKSVV